MDNTDTEYTYPPKHNPWPENVLLHHQLMNKYLRLLHQPAYSRDAALLAGLAALHDLDAIVTDQAESRLDAWREKHHDQTATISDLENTLNDAARQIDMHRDSANLWRTQYDISQAQLSALEAECNRLRQHYADSERNYEKSVQLAHEARTVRSMIRAYLLPHLVTPNGYLAFAHLPDDHWSFQKRLLDNDGEPLEEPAISSNLIELAHEMFENLEDRIAELHGQRDGLWTAYNELKTTTTASSQPTTAQTAPSAPAASTTSKPPAPTPPFPAASSTASADPAAPAPSATTTPPAKRTRQTPKNPLPSAAAGNEEAGQTTAQNPIDWQAALAGLLTSEEIGQLERKEIRWFRLNANTQRQLVLRIATTIYRHLGTISQSIYQEYSPAWATSVGSWTATCQLTWADVLQTLGVVPTTKPKNSRIVLSASQP